MRGNGSAFFSSCAREKGSAAPLVVLTVLIAMLLLFLIVRTTIQLETNIQEQAQADASALAGANIEAVALDANAAFNILDLVLHGAEIATLTVSTVIGVPLALSIILTPEGLSILSTGLQVADQLFEVNMTVTKVRDQMNTILAPLATMGGVPLLPLLSGETSRISLPYPFTPRGEEPYFTREDCLASGSGTSSSPFGTSHLKDEGKAPPASLVIQAKATNPAIALAQLKGILKGMSTRIFSESGEANNPAIQAIIARQEKAAEYMRKVLDSVSQYDPTSTFDFPSPAGVHADCAQILSSTQEQLYNNISTDAAKNCASAFVSSLMAKLSHYDQMITNWENNLKSKLSDSSGILFEIRATPKDLLSLRGGGSTGSSGETPNSLGETLRQALYPLYQDLTRTQGALQCVANNCPQGCPNYCSGDLRAEVRSLLYRYEGQRTALLNLLKSYTQGVVSAALERFQNLVEKRNQEGDCGGTPCSSPNARALRSLGTIFGKVGELSCASLQGIPEFPMVTLLHPSFYEKQIVGTATLPLDNPLRIRISEAQPVPPPGVKPGTIVIKPGYRTRLREAEFPSRIFPGFASFVTAFTHH